MGEFRDKAANHLLKRRSRRKNGGKKVSVSRKRSAVKPTLRLEGEFMQKK